VTTNYIPFSLSSQTLPLRQLHTMRVTQSIRTNLEQKAHFTSALSTLGSVRRTSRRHPCVKLPPSDGRRMTQQLHSLRANKANLRGCALRARLVITGGIKKTWNEGWILWTISWNLKFCATPRLPYTVNYWIPGMMRKSLATRVSSPKGKMDSHLQCRAVLDSEIPNLSMQDFKNSLLNHFSNNSW